MYKVTKETLQLVVNYLATKPYAEVFELIKVLQQSEKIEEKEDGNKGSSKSE